MTCHCHTVNHILKINGNYYYPCLIIIPMIQFFITIDNILFKKLNCYNYVLNIVAVSK